MQDHMQLEGVVVGYQDTVKFPGLVVNSKVVYFNRVESPRLLCSYEWGRYSRISLRRVVPIYAIQDMLAKALETT